MAHGYIDSVAVPLHLPPSAYQPQCGAKGGNKGKGKEVAGAGDAKSQTYDVVGSWTAQEREEMQRKVAMASLLGYSTLLLTISIPPTFDPALLSFPTPLFPQLDPRTTSPGTEGLVMQMWRINVENYGDEAVKGAGQKGWYGFANSTAHLYPPQTTLLSVSPTNLTSFSHVALSLSPPTPFAPTLITLDPSISPRLPFPLKRGMISSLARSGVCFELILRGVTRLDQEGEQPGDSGKRRRNWIAGAREVVRATEGKGVVVSSGAVRAGEMRGTEDLINLCSLIGMPPAQAKDALTVSPQRAIMRGLSLRQTYRGVISNPTLTTYASANSSPFTATTIMTVGVAAKKRSAPEAASNATSTSGSEGVKAKKKRKEGGS
ncbi:RNase P subunit p30 family protein [Rhodotorula toruloides]|uniref:RNase P subunit p30 family protein n=1 Tax=Rhodotorula toruloides TaxID=5286 RepID=A0A511KK87_RHOTO|nr:RNase P subunit p30 family protein [Rhodotorula toruloides]